MLKFNLVVVPTDFSDHSLRALPYAVGFAEQFGARLALVYVLEPSLQLSDIAWVGVDERAVDADHMSHARASLDHLARERVPDEIACETHVLHGHPVDAIVEFASESGADLIVMATHGRSGLSHVLMGSIAENVVRRAPCPVLTLKSPLAVASD